MSKTISLLFSFFFLACASTGHIVFEKPGTSLTQGDQDRHDCILKAYHFSTPNSVPPNWRELGRKRYEDCMTGKGYSPTIKR